MFMVEIMHQHKEFLCLVHLEWRTREKRSVFGSQMIQSLWPAM